MPSDEIYPGEDILYADRSGITTDWLCGMRFWWNRKQNGYGIVPTGESIHLRDGRDVHEDLHAVAELEDLSVNRLGDAISEILGGVSTYEMANQATMERLYRRLGWLAAFGLYIEPEIRKEYETVATESEIILDREPLWIAVTPDRLLRHREDRYLTYREWKSTISAGPKWVNHWPYAVQIHLGLKAIEEEISEKIAFAQVVGLMKGEYYRDRLSHPYVWAYRNGDKWTHDYTKARSAGWDHAPVWEYPGGVVEWVTKLGEEVARGQFPHSAPVFLNERLLDEMIKRRIAREVEIRSIEDRCHTDHDLRALHFEQRFEACRPAFGDPCPYLAACHNAGINQDPIGSGLYQIRVPHHEIEVQYIKGEM